MKLTKYRFKDRAEAEAQFVKSQEEADHYGIALRASMLDTWDGYACGTEGRKWYAIVALALGGRKEYGEEIELARAAIARAEGSAP